MPSPIRQSRLPARIFLVAAVVLLLAGAALRMRAVSQHSLWIDEISTSLHVRTSLDRFIDLELANGGQLPLYYALVRAVPGDTDLALRYPSILFGLLGIALVIAAVRRLYHDDWLALGAGALVTFSPYHVWFSRDARPYALFFGIVVLVSTLFLLMLSGRRSRAMWIAFWLSSAAAYLTHYYALTLALVQLIVLMATLRDDRRFYWRWVGVQALAALPFAVWMIARITGSELWIGSAWIPQPDLADIPLTITNLGTGYGGTASWLLAPAMIVFGAGLLAGMLRAIRRPASDRRINPVDFYWLWLLVLPVAVFFAVSLWKPLFVDRYFIICLPAVTVLMLRGWQQVPRPQGRAALLLVVAVTGAATTLHKIDAGHFEPQDWRDAARYIEAHHQPGDAFTNDTPLSLLCIEHYYGDDDAIRDHAYDVFTEDADPVPARRLWVVYLNPIVDVHRLGLMPGFDPFAPGLNFIGDYLIAHREHVIDRQDFNGLSVLLLAFDAPAG